MICKQAKCYLRVIAFIFCNILVITLSSCLGGKRTYQINQVALPVGHPIQKSVTHCVTIVHVGYTVSFDTLTKLPVWVAYELTEEETFGDVKRDNHFYQDPNVNGSQADNVDYQNSGWDKGHMAPAGDMKWSSQAMYESCYFTNICPQNHNLNGGDWRLLEEKCRNLAQKYQTLYIVCGPIIGNAKNGTLGLNKVVIPDAFYKVLLAKTEKGYQSVGFVYENKAGHHPFSYYARTIDQIEHITGLDFFSNLPDSVENRIESMFDLGFWGMQ